MSGLPAAAQIQSYLLRSGSHFAVACQPLYLHYVPDQWVQAWRKKVARGDVIVVRYADDAVLGFQYRGEAEKFPNSGGMPLNGGASVGKGSRKPIGKRMAAKLKKIRQQLRQRACADHGHEWVAASTAESKNPLDLEQILGAPREPASGS